jgi:hypothetical protein
MSSPQSPLDAFSGQSKSSGARFTTHDSSRPHAPSTSASASGQTHIIGSQQSSEHPVLNRNSHISPLVLPPEPIDSRVLPPVLDTYHFDKPEMYAVHSSGAHGYGHPVQSSSVPVWPAYSAPLKVPQGDYFSSRGSSGRSSSQYPIGKGDFPSPFEFYPPDVDPAFRDQYYLQDSAGHIIQPTPIVYSGTPPVSSPFNRPHNTPSPTGSVSSTSSGSFSSRSASSTSSGRSVRWNDERLVCDTPLAHTPPPRGFWNRRGDRLWSNSGLYKAARPGCEYPPELAHYPDYGEGWMNEEGDCIDMNHRRVAKFCRPPPKSALKKTGGMTMRFEI